MTVVVVTGRMPRSGKLPVLNLLTGDRPEIRFFAPQGRLVAPIHVKLGRADGHVHGSAWLCKIHLNPHRGVGMRPSKYQKFPLFGNFFRGFYTPNYPSYISVSNFM